MLWFTLRTLLQGEGTKFLATLMELAGRGEGEGKGSYRKIEAQIFQLITMPPSISYWMIKLYWPKHDLDAHFGGTLVFGEEDPGGLHCTFYPWWPCTCPCSQLLSLEFRTPGLEPVSPATHHVIFRKLLCSYSQAQKMSFLSVAWTHHWEGWHHLPNVFASKMSQVAGERPGRGTARHGGLCQTSGLQELSALWPALLWWIETWQHVCLRGLLLPLPQHLGMGLPLKGP